MLKGRWVDCGNLAVQKALQLSGSNLGVDLSIDRGGGHSKNARPLLPILDLGVEILDDTSIRMILFGVVCFIKDQQVDLVHSDVGMGEALVEDLGGADNGHILVKGLLPKGLAERDILDHVPAEFLNGIVQVAGQHGMLLEHESNLVDEEESDALGKSLRSVLQLILDDPSQKQGSNESLAGACRSYQST